MGDRPAVADPAPGGERFVEALLQLDFSRYEARCYVGLLVAEPRTAYAVAKSTGVPEPKVYEALRRLVARGAARRVPGQPARYIATAPEELLDDLQAAFEQRLLTARRTTPDVAQPADGPSLADVTAVSGRSAVLATASAALESATRRVYLSASARELAALDADLLACAGRGVDVVVLAFGHGAPEAPGIRVFRHASTDGAVFRAHQARHVALVMDSRHTVFGLAADGRTWSGVSAASPPIIAAVKGYIRHDIDMQQVFADFGADLVSAYGPGLQQLESYRADPSARVGGAADATEVAAPRRRTSRAGG